MYYQQIMADQYKEIFLKALEVINYSNKKGHLMNLWNFLNLKPIEPAVEYVNIPENISFKKRWMMSMLWKKFQVTETGYTSIFSCMERLKLVTSTINHGMNLNYLIEQKYIKSVFALNDDYELHGSNKRKQLSMTLKSNLQI